MHQVWFHVALTVSFILQPRDISLCPMLKIPRLLTTDQPHVGCIQSFDAAYQSWRRFVVHIEDKCFFCDTDSTYCELLLVAVAVLRSFWFGSYLPERILWCFQHPA